MPRRHSLGILSNADMITNRSRHKFLEEVVKSAQKRGMDAYIFNPQVFDDKIKGYALIGNSWQEKIFDLPTVVYDRGFFQKPESQNRATKTRQSLRERNIPFVNPVEVMVLTGSKSRFSQAMLEGVVPHPETKNYSVHNVGRLLDKHKKVVLKPNHGMKGKGIVFLEKNRDGSYVGRYKVKDAQGEWRKEEFRINDLSHLDDRLARVRRKTHVSGDDTYIVQEMVEFYNYKDKQTDFRMIFHRGDEGKWRRTYVGARVGGNLSQDGEANRYSAVIDDFVRIYNGEHDRPVTAEQVKEWLSEAGKKAFLAIEKKCKKRAGEIGVDLVLAKRGNEWGAIVIEANSKPGHGIFQRLDAPRHYKNTLERIVGYAHHLSGNPEYQNRQ